MAINITHKAVAVGSNAGNGEIRKSQWNDNHNVTFLQDGTGAATRTLDSKVKESVSVKDFGAVGDGVTDDTAAIQAAIAASNSLYWPPGVYCVGQTISVVSKTNWHGASATIKHTHQANYATPLIIVQTAASESSFSGIAFDHNAVGVAEPSMTNSFSYALLTPFLIMADDVSVRECQALNAWDSGFAVGRMTISGNGSVSNPFSVTVINGKPERVRISDSYAFNAGHAVHSLDNNDKKGNGFNILNGTRCIVDNCIADRCSCGFASELGANASAVFSSCTAVGSRYATGWGFWIADGPNVVSGCSALFCEKEGFVIPPEANGVSLTGCYAFANGRHGFKISSAKSSVTGCVAQANSQGTANTYSGFFLDSSGESLTEVLLVGCLSLAEGAEKYGLDAFGLNTISAQVMGCSFTGVTAEQNISTYSISVISHKKNTRFYGFNTPVPEQFLSVSGDPVSYLTTALGDTGNNGVLGVNNSTTPTKRIAFAYDGTNDAGVIQSMHAGVTKKPLLLNPSGGRVVVGNGSWNTGPMSLGSYYLWVDGSAKLRIKSGAPTSDTDGTVVGTQT